MKTMNRKCLLLSVGLFAACAGWTQSNSFFYNENQNTYSMDNLPGTTDYIAGGTVYRPSQTYIHLVQYDQAGFPTATAPIFIYEQNFDTRLAKVIPLNIKRVWVVAYSRNLTGTTSNINCMLVDMTLPPPINVIFSQKISSNDPNYPSLIPTDAIWDANTNEMVICGTASGAYMPTEFDSKAAFLLKTNFGGTTMRFYDTPSGGSGTDYDIATRVVKDAQGDYYITGSENMFKPNLGTYTMGIKSTYIDDVTMNTNWDFPLYINENGKDNGVDMAEFQGRFNLLINTEDNGMTWNIIPLNSSNGAPILSYSQHFDGNRCQAHHFLPGNYASQGIFTVVGMRYDLIPGSCKDTDPDNAVPFVSHVNLLPLPGNIMGTFSYPTIVGTHDPGFSVDYWTLGDFYAPRPTYGLPVFLHKFGARQDPFMSGEYGLIAPIMNPSMTALNTKFIFTKATGENDCAFNQCDHGFKERPITAPGGSITTSSPTTGQFSANIPSNDYPYYMKYVCPGDPYYRPAVNTGTATAKPAGETSVYPNPANDRLTVNLSEFSGMDVTVDLLGMDGKVLGNMFTGQAADRIGYDIPANTPKGIYMVRIRSNAKSVTHKLVIQ